MERLRCVNCRSRVGAREVVCRSCGAPLLKPGAVQTEVVPDPPAIEDPISETEATGAGPDPELPAAGGHCPRCGAGVTDPQSLVCLQCLGELRPAAQPARSAHAASSAGPRLTLQFRLGGTGPGEAVLGGVEVRAGEEVQLGREVPAARLPALGAFDHVSRIHATVSIAADGTAWARDEGSTNGTFIDGRPLPPHVVVPLPAGAELRLASNLRATVQIASLPVAGSVVPGGVHD